MSHHLRKHHLILGLLALAVAASLVYSYTTLRVGNFGPGPTETRPTPNPRPTPQPTPEPKPIDAGKCFPSGCSGQICSDENMVSDCMYRAEYACYKTATCERQSDGKCGWTPSAQLSACLAQPPALDGPQPQ